jgi:hypothetical protein
VVRGICEKPRVKCGDCPHRSFLPVTDDIIRWHLSGHDDSGQPFVAGVYPMLQDESCLFLAIDFDKDGWQQDVKAFIDACRTRNLPAAVEPSRSGRGGHVWFFFEEAIPATLARKLGSFLLTETMERRPDVGLDSYDRLFPNQDTLPQGGFGNLIALPLQKQARERGNSVFLDESLEPHADQWSFLSGVGRLGRARVERVVADADRQGGVIGVRIPSLDDDDREPWTLSSSRAPKTAIQGELPDRLEVILANEIYVPCDGLTPALRNRILRLAAFQNPEFYRAQAMRLPTYDKPRVIGCAEQHPHHLGLPRGCLQDLRGLLDDLNIRLLIRDERCAGEPLDVVFCDELRPEQLAAADALVPHDTGVLAATTAFGKTVIAAWMLAQRRVNTLVLVHRQQLLDQWVDRLSTFLGMPQSRFGRIGGGKRKATGQIDIALIQSLVRKGVVSDCVADYGHLIVDECHHLSAHSFEQVARRARAKYVLGLSATVTRKDGHHPIIFMQCGPTRYRVSAKVQAAGRPFSHSVIVRPTAFVSPREPDTDKRVQFQAVYKELVGDERRNQLICNDVLHVKRLVRDGVDVPLASLFVDSARPLPNEAEGIERARSATEAFFYRRLETLDATKGLFLLNADLPIPFDGWSKMEVDLLSRELRVAVELDGPQHLADAVAYRRDRRKDRLLQEQGYLVLRFLAKDVAKDLDGVLDVVLRVLTRRGQVGGDN